MTAKPRHTDLIGLESLALEQGGYFDRADAQAHGLDDALLHYYVRRDRFERLFPGVYRLRIAPRVAHDDLLLAWVWSNYRGVVSHESALALFDLGDVIPDRVHLTVPLTFRRSPVPWIVTHRAVLRADETATYEGLQTTTPARAIVDAAAAGGAPDQIQKSLLEALARGLASPSQVRAAARRRGYRHKRTVEPLIEATLAGAD